MSGTSGSFGGEERWFWWVNVKARYHLEDHCRHGRII